MQLVFFFCTVWFFLFLLTICFCLRHSFHTLFCHVSFLSHEYSRQHSHKRQSDLTWLLARAGNCGYLNVSLVTSTSTDHVWQVYKWPSALGGIPLNQQGNGFRMCQESAQQRWRPRQIDVGARDSVWCWAVCLSQVEGRVCAKRCCHWRLSSVYSLYWWLRRIAK